MWVERDLGQDARTLHLDGNRRGVGVLESAPVHLTNGGRCDGRRGERLEEVRDVAHAKLRTQHAIRLIRRKGRHRVLQLAQLERVGFRDQVRANR